MALLFQDKAPRKAIGASNCTFQERRQVLEARGGSALLRLGEGQAHPGDLGAERGKELSGPPPAAEAEELRF